MCLPISVQDNALHDLNIILLTNDVSMTFFIMRTQVEKILVQMVKRIEIDKQCASGLA